MKIPGHSKLLQKACSDRDKAVALALASARALYGLALQPHTCYGWEGKRWNFDRRLAQHGKQALGYEV